MPLFLRPVRSLLETGVRSARGELLAAAKIARELFDPRLSRVLSDAIIIAVLAAGLTLLAASSPSGRRSMALLLIPACYLALGYVVMPSMNDNGPGSEGPLRITLTCGPVAVIASVAVIMAVRYIRRHDLRAVSAAAMEPAVEQRKHLQDGGDALSDQVAAMELRRTGRRDWSCRTGR